MKKFMILSLSLLSALQLAQGQSNNQASQKLAPSADRVQVLEGELLKQRQENQELREEVRHLQESLQQQSRKNQPAASQAAGNAAAEQRVACPIDLVRTEITTPLPKPWWNTPQVGKLLGVDIAVIGGEKTLVCEYWAYGHQVAVMRHLPEETNECSIAPEGNGFSCH